jgi:preprotein translocase SecE subunit
MAKVSWPSREELTGSTVLVIVLSVAIAVVVMVFDRVLAMAVSLFLK